MGELGKEGDYLGWFVSCGEGGKVVIEISRGFSGNSSWRTQCHNSSEMVTFRFRRSSSSRIFIGFQGSFHIYVFDFDGRGIKIALYLSKVVRENNFGPLFS